MIGKFLRRLLLELFFQKKHNLWHEFELSVQMGFIEEIAYCACVKLHL